MSDGTYRGKTGAGVTFASMVWEWTRCAGAHAVTPRFEEIPMRKLLLAICFVCIGSAVALAPAAAQPQFNVGFNGGGVNIGINVGAYPRLVPIPGYPVYYAPQVNANYFFYDGRFWTYVDDNWYTSAWYDGPWQFVPPEAVPLYVLRIPVRYYRRPPPYFHAWAASAPPRWGEHWGRSWEQRRRGWDRWDHRAVPRLAPLPTYQRHYAGNRYPRADQQQALHAHNYGYQRREGAAQYGRQYDRGGRQYDRGLESRAGWGRGQTAAAQQSAGMQAQRQAERTQGQQWQRRDVQAQFAQQQQQRQAMQAQHAQRQQQRQAMQAQHAQRQQPREVMQAQHGQRQQERQASHAQRPEHQAQQGEERGRGKG
jgi:hypothetical protein